MKYQDTQNPHAAVIVDDEGYVIFDLRTPNPNAEKIATDVVAMRQCLAEAVLVIEDFMPNLGRCVLQDYARLNAVLCDSARLLKEY